MPSVFVMRTAPAGVTVFDNFNRANSATTPNPASDGGAWTVESGTWGVSSNQGYVASTSPGTLGLKLDGLVEMRRDLGTSAADVTVTTTRINTSGSSAVFCTFDPSSFACYALLFDSSSGFFFVRRHTGNATYSILGTPAPTAWTGGSTTLRLTHDGAGLVKAYQGSTLLGSYTDATPLTGTWVGLADLNATSNKWDDFSAIPA